MDEITRVLERYDGYMAVVIIRMGVPPSDREDVKQDARVGVWQFLETSTGEIQDEKHQRSAVGLITRRAAYGYWRSQKLRPRRPRRTAKPWPRVSFDSRVVENHPRREDSPNEFCAHLELDDRISQIRNEVGTVAAEAIVLTAQGLTLAEVSQRLGRATAFIEQLMKTAEKVWCESARQKMRLA